MLVTFGAASPVIQPKIKPSETVRLNLDNVVTSALEMLNTNRLSDLQSLMVNLSQHKELGVESRKAVGTVANQITSHKEAEALFNESKSLTPKARSHLGNAIVRALRTVAHAEETRARKAQEYASSEGRALASGLFDPRSSKRAVEIRVALDDHGVAVAKAAIVFVDAVGVDVASLERHMNVLQSGNYLRVNDLTIVGVSAESARKSNHQSPSAAALFNAEVWNEKNGRRYEIMEQPAMWAGGAFALLIKKSDMRVLNAAANGRFRYKSWGLAYSS